MLLKRPAGVGDLKNENLWYFVNVYYREKDPSCAKGNAPETCASHSI